jgi:aminoglycoside 6'-N-acetyltransferase I
LIKVRLYDKEDRSEWLRMRLALWPDIGSGADAERDADDWLSRPDAVVIVAERAREKGLAGFAEVGRRDYADGSFSRPVAFLEGWYVDLDVRNRGVGAALIVMAEEWARGRGYRELASDALLENITSHKAHLAVGFEEVERSIKYRKLL